LKLFDEFLQVNSLFHTAKEHEREKETDRPLQLAKETEEQQCPKYGMRKTLQQKGKAKKKEKNTRRKTKVRERNTTLSTHSPSLIMPHCLSLRV
jgi:hypothetical protein